MKLLNSIPYIEITKSIEKEALGGDNPWFDTREEFEEWAGDILDCIMFQVLDDLGINYYTDYEDSDYGSFFLR